MLFFNQKISFSRVLRYVFFVTLTFWGIVSIPIFYNYAINSSQKVVSKGGTFVEGIFSTTSYLPYLSSTPQSLFYQGLLFRSCLSYDINSDAYIQYDNDLCKVDTTDYKTYYVSIIPENTRSDGVPVSLDDVYATYKKILISNMFNIKNLEKYTNISIGKEANRIKITFPNATRDNNIFFTNYILPNHALLSLKPNIDMYQQSFALEPVYNNCAKIHSQSTDQYSLVFDLTQCKDTSIGFYQIKNLQNFNTFQKILEKDGESIIDVYEENNVLTGYQKQLLKTDKYMMAFFNTKSPKLLVRVRRALGGLIHHELEKAKDIKMLEKYTNKIFNTHRSDGNDIKDFLVAALSEEGTNIKNIKDSGIKLLPKKVAIKNTNQAYSYYTENNKNMIQFSVDQKYEKVAVQFNEDTLYYPKSYNKNKKNFSYSISLENENLKKGINSYIIYGIFKKKKIKLASLKLYLVDSTQHTETKKTEKKIKVLYYKNSTNEYTVNIIKKIFTKHNILNFFVFEGFDDESKVHGAISNGNYDIFIGSIDSSLKRDFYGFINTNKSILNPSSYTNKKITSLLEQHNKSPENTTIIDEINTMYANNMPFIVIGKEQKILAIDPKIKKQFSEKKDILLHEYNRRDIIYDHLVLTKNTYISSKGLFNLKNFYSYLTK